MSGGTMRELHDHDDLVERLVALGDVLDLDDPSLADSVLERIGEPPRPSRRGWLIAAAAALVVTLVASVVLQPGARDAMARWFGLDGVDVEVDPGLSTPASMPSFSVPGPGESEIVMVDGRRVLYSALEGRLTDTLITKTVQATDQVREVDVAGHPGLWISGGPHEVLYEAPDSGVIVERVAADTLLWQDGPVLYRVEGFADLDAALAFAEGT